MQRRTRPGRRPTSPFRWLGWLAALLVVAGIVLVLLAPSLVTGYIRSYLRTDEFRHKAESMITAKLGGRAHLAPLMWNDDTATITDLSLETDDGWNVDAGGLHLSLDFGAIRTGVWRIQNAGADDLTLRHTANAASQGMADTVSFEDTDAAIPALLRRYIPSQTDLSGLDVHRFYFERENGASTWKLADSELHLGAWTTGVKSAPARLTGGTLQTPIRAPEQKDPLKFDLTQATLRVGTEQFQVSDATLRWKQQSEATLRGHFKFGSGIWQTFIHAKTVPVDEFLNTTWKQRLSGQIEGDLELSGARNAPVAWKADAALKNGVLMGLPILEKLATYTKSERFKRLVLDICQASILPQGDALRLENIIVQSNGLLRIEGRLNIRGQAMEGDFMLGVTPETLRWIPGADSRVFTATNSTGPPGLMWTNVRVAGTLDAPQEDLSSRLIGAAGMSLLLDTPGKVINQGADLLLKPVLGQDAAKVPGKVIEGASGLLENGVKTGAGILNQVLPGFPGK